jgi:hypothetical protein
MKVATSMPAPVTAPEPKPVPVSGPADLLAAMRTAASITAPAAAEQLPVAAATEEPATEELAAAAAEQPTAAAREALERLGTIQSLDSTIPFCDAGEGPSVEDPPAAAAAKEPAAVEPPAAVAQMALERLGAIQSLDSTVPFCCAAEDDDWMSADGSSSSSSPRPRAAPDSSDADGFDWLSRLLYGPRGAQKANQDVIRTGQGSSFFMPGPLPAAEPSDWKPEDDDDESQSWPAPAEEPEIGFLELLRNSDLSGSMPMYSALS